MKYKKQIPQVKSIGLQNNFHYNNKLGLDKAYASKSGTHVENDVMYIAGTRNMRDFYDDITKLPFGQTKHAQRYKDADRDFSIDKTLRIYKLDNITRVDEDYSGICNKNM